MTIKTSHLGRDGTALVAAGLTRQLVARGWLNKCCEIVDRVNQRANIHTSATQRAKPTGDRTMVKLSNISIQAVKAVDCFPAAASDFFQVSGTDQDGIVWSAATDFSTLDAAEAFAAADFDETEWECYGPSYALGQVDEVSLMDDEERFARGF